MNIKEKTSEIFYSIRKIVRPLDFVFLAAMLFAGVYLTSRLFTSKSEDRVVIFSPDGEYSYPLTKEKHIYRVKGPLGVTAVEVEDFRARVADSPCPGKNCVNMGTAELIICVPNQIVVETKRKQLSEKGEFDALSQ